MKSKRQRKKDQKSFHHAKSDTQKTIDFLRMTIEKEGSIFRFAREAGVITRNGRLTRFYRQKLNPLRT
ncbi:hypothetical protein [Limnobacter alexandrii]|uniref:hypothetical protein n=1 Tax=Limnobacter alexandrii TaxID=2570352 RepID=UPI001108A6A4|nr:hypothetical protein [Limnobacter alexandrii]